MKQIYNNLSGCAEVSNKYAYNKYSNITITAVNNIFITLCQALC